MLPAAAHKRCTMQRMIEPRPMVQLRSRGQHVLHRPLRHVRHAADGDVAAAADPAPANPLERLRVCRDPVERSKWMLELNGQWSEAYKAYTPSPAEVFLSEALGQTPYSCMMLAVQNGQIAPLDVPTQLRPALHTLKAANVDLLDIWHLATKQPFLFAAPDTLQRWLDFLAVYGLQPRDLLNFCLRVPPATFLDATIHTAGVAITYLRTLGIHDEFLATRLISLWPAILSQDVTTQLAPVVQFLQSLGMEVPEITTTIMRWPELLLCDVATNLVPMAEYLTGLGCGPTNVAQVIMECPHLARFEPATAFEPKLQPLRQLGIGAEDLRSMLQIHSGFLAITGGCSQQLEALTELGLPVPLVRSVIVRCPQVLQEKPLELQRKWEFLRDVLGGSERDLERHPVFLRHGLMQTIGPRYYFAAHRRKLQEVFGSGGGGKAGQEEGGVAAGGLGEGGVRGGSGLDLTRLVGLSDVEFVEALDASWNEFTGFSFRWQKDYTQKINLESEASFQEELARVFQAPGQARG